MKPDEPVDEPIESQVSIDPFATEISSPIAFQPQNEIKQLGDYRLLRMLGRGGMGIVYEAEPMEGGCRVALKTLQVGSTAALRKLKSEFRIVADLAHPNLVRLGELNTTDREPFFTMEILQGKPFDEHVRSSFESASAMPHVPYNEGRLRNSLRQLADGLVALHEEGLIHRDIKPSNVMITNEGRVVILDMGITVEMDGAKFRNSQNEMAGTPYFMSPEQTRGETITPACDWYCVGVMLFEALTGERAFHSRQLDALLKEKSEGADLCPRDVLSAVPEDLNNLCRDLLRPLPEDRPSGEEILSRLHGQAPSAFESSIWIGRENELRMLNDSWQRIRDGFSTVVLVSGPSGLGKTALVDYFLSSLRRQESVVVLRGRCYENEAVAYRGFDSVVDSLANYLGRLPKSEVERVLPLDIDMLCQLFPVIGEVPAVANHRSRSAVRYGDPRERRQKGIAALRELICRLARFVPVIIFIDDLQQGDEDTAAIFRELFRRDESPTALFVATYRNEDAETNACLKWVRRSQRPTIEQNQLTDQLEIVVGKLSHDESIRLAASLLLRHQITSMIDVEKIADEADGDPLFIRMLAGHRVRHHDQSGDSKTDSVLRWTLATVIQDRVKSLENHERAAMEALAAAGRPIDEHALESVVNASGQTIGLIRSLRVNRMIRRLGDRRRVEPFHDKIRDTILGMIPPKRLARYCLTLAERMDQDTSDRDVEFLADLYRRGGEKLKAGEYYEVAAGIADSMYAFQRAIEYYGFAIELLQPRGDRERVIRKGLGDALANASRSAEAAKQYELAAAAAKPDEQAKLQQLASLRYLTSGHVEEGIDSLRGVLVYNHLPWPKNRFAVVAGLLGRIAYLRIRGLRIRANAQPTGESQDKRDACWSAAAGLSLVDPLRGSYYIAETLCRSLHAGSVATVPRDLAAYMGLIAVGGSGSRRATRRVLLACRQITATHRDHYSRAMQFIARGIAALLRGQWSASLGCCDRAIKLLADPTCHGKTWELNTARTFGLWALQYQGNLLELSHRQPELVRAAKEADDLFATLNFGTQVMAHLQLAGDQPEESLRRLREDEDHLSDRGFYIQHHNFILAKTYTLLYQNRVAEAMSTIDGTWRNYQREYLSQIQQVRIDHRQVATRVLLAAASEHLDSDNMLKRATKQIVSLRAENVRWASALAEVFDAACHRIEGNKTIAESKLVSAIKMLDAAGMVLFATAARRHLASLTGQALSDETKPWSELGVANGERMARMLVPGFDIAES